MPRNRLPRTLKTYRPTGRSSKGRRSERRPDGENGTGRKWPNCMLARYDDDDDDDLLNVMLFLSTKCGVRTAAAPGFINSRPAAVSKGQNPVPSEQQAVSEPELHISCRCCVFPARSLVTTLSELSQAAYNRILGGATVGHFAVASQVSWWRGEKERTTLDSTGGYHILVAQQFLLLQQQQLVCTLKVGCLSF